MVRRRPASVLGAEVEFQSDLEDCPDRFWRRRWRDASASAGVAARLSDAPRCGAPATFTPEVICQIMALACEDPETLDVPISHWSQSELARQSVARGIVKSISHGSVGRF